MSSPRHQHAHAVAGRPSTWSSGIRQSSKTSSHVPDPRIPSLSRCWAVVNPAMPRSTTKAVIGDAPPASLRPHVDDQHVGLGAVRDPHLRAVRDPAAVDASRATAHRPEDVGARLGLAHRERADVLARRAARGAIGRVVRGCRSSTGCERTGSSARAYDNPTDAEARDTSSTITRCSRKPSPAPPSSGGDRRPSTPRSPSIGQSLPGERVGGVDVGRQRRDLALGEQRGRRSQLLERDPVRRCLRRIHPLVIPTLRRSEPCRAPAVRWPNGARPTSAAEERCPDCPHTSTPARRASVTTRRRCSALVEDLAVRLDRVRGGGGAEAVAKHESRGQAHRPRAHRTAGRPRRRVPRALAAGRRGSLRRRGPRRRHRHRDRSRSTAGRASWSPTTPPSRAAPITR